MSITDQEPVEDHPDRVDFLDTGRIRVWADGTRYVLRLPKHGEFKRFRLMVTPDPDEDEPEPSARDRAEAGFEQVEQWMREVFATLGDRKLPDDADDWPAWLLSPLLATRFLVHWRDVPLAPGAQPKT